MTEIALQLTASAAQEKRDKVVSLPWLIGFTFAFRTCLTLLLFKSNPVLGTAVNTILSLTGLTLATFSYFGAPPATPASYFKTPLFKWITAFLALSLLSFTWSPAPLLSSAGYWTAWAADIAAVCLVLRYRPPQEQAASLMRGFVIGASLVAVVAWSIPTTSDLRLGNEEYLHPNTIAHLFGLAALIAIYLGRESHIWRIPALALVITVLRSLSKTSIIALLAALAFHFLRDSSLTRAVRIRIGLLTAVVLAFFWGLLETYLDSYSQGASPETLTGRTFLWSVAAELALLKPWLGYGFYSFRSVVPMVGSFEAVHAHNELLQQFLSFGVAGVIIFIGIHLTFYRQIRRSRPGNLKTLASALLIFALIRGLTDTEIYDLSFPLWLMAMLSILLCSQPPDPPALAPSLPAQITPLQ